MSSSVSVKLRYEKCLQVWGNARRHPENKQLREKINHIQDLSQQLLSLIHHVEKETIATARAGQVADLPNVALAASLSDAFEGQRSAIALIQQDIRGNVSPIKQH
jgi:hypothetical protein